jgi:hypothetical protein
MTVVALGQFPAMPMTRYYGKRRRASHTATICADESGRDGDLEQTVTGPRRVWCDPRDMYVPGRAQGNGYSDTCR